MFIARKCKVLDFKMEIKHLIPYASKTIVSSNSTIMTKVLWFRNPKKKWFSEVKLAEVKMNLIWNC